MRPLTTVSVVGPVGPASTPPVPLEDEDELLLDDELPPVALVVVVAPPADEVVVEPPFPRSNGRLPQATNAARIGAARASEGKRRTAAD